MSTTVLTPGPEAPPPSDNLAGVLELMQKLVNQVAEESRAKTTHYQQGQQWNAFLEWCKARGFQSLPADPEAVAVFIFTQGIGGRKPNTLRGYASSIAARHRFMKLENHCNDRVAMIIKGFVNRAKKAGQEGGPRRRANGRNRLALSPPRIWRRSEPPPASSARPTAVGNVSPTPNTAAEWTSPSSR